MRGKEETALKEAKAAFEKWEKDLEKINTDTANCDKKCEAYTKKEAEKSTVDTNKTWKKLYEDLDTKWKADEKKRDEDKKEADLKVREAAWKEADEDFKEQEKLMKVLQDEIKEYEGQKKKARTNEDWEHADKMLRENKATLEGLEAKFKDIKKVYDEEFAFKKVRDEEKADKEFKEKKANREKDTDYIAQKKAYDDAKKALDAANKKVDEAAADKKEGVKTSEKVDDKQKTFNEALAAFKTFRDAEIADETFMKKEASYKAK